MDPSDSRWGNSTALRDTLGKKSLCELARASDTCYTSAAAEVMSDVSARTWSTWVENVRQLKFCPA